MPVTRLETFITICTMFFGLLLNAFVISSFTSAFSKWDSKKELAGNRCATSLSFPQAISQHLLM